MKNYEMVGYDSPEEGAVKMILSYALDNYGEYSDEDIDDIYKRFLANKEWLRKERE
jgi:hypothetical protein